MIDLALVFRWTRDVMAVLGVLGCLIVLGVLFVILTYDGRAAEESPEERSPPGAPSWLVDEAGLGDDLARLEYFRGRKASEEPFDGVLGWCYRVDAPLVLGERWRPLGTLDASQLQALEHSLDAAHAFEACVPTAKSLPLAGTRARLMRVELSDGHPSAATLAIYDGSNQKVYLVRASYLMPPPPSANSSPGS